MWVEIRGRERRKNIMRKSTTNGQERENEYKNERRNEWGQAKQAWMCKGSFLTVGSLLF